MRKSIFRVILAVIILNFTVSPVLAYNYLFKDSDSCRYMAKHRSKKYAKKRVAVMAWYFKKRNPGLTGKAARNYASLVEAIAEKYKVDPFIISSIIVKESTVRVKAKSGKAYGLMQINWNANKKWIPKVFPTVKSKSKLLHSKPNIYVGTYMMRTFLRESGGNVDKALDRYRGRSIVSYRTKIHIYYSEQVNRFKKKL